MSTERDAFEVLLKDNPQDWTTRLIYADWLEEHGFDDEAQRQREFKAAWEWMENLAAEGGVSVTNYGMEDESGELEIEQEEPITMDILISAGHEYMDSEGHAYFVQMGSETLRNLVSGEEADKYWRYWSVITGRQEPPVPEKWRREGPFSCNC